MATLFSKYPRWMRTKNRNYNWTESFSLVLGLIFVVDSNDRDRISEAREELQRMLSEDELRDAIILIFANKQVTKSEYFPREKIRVEFIFLPKGFTASDERRWNHRQIGSSFVTQSSMVHSIDLCNERRRSLRRSRLVVESVEKC